MKVFKTLAIAVLVGLLGLFLLIAGCFVDYGGDYHGGRAISDLQTIQQALRKLAVEENFTAADWDRIDSMATVGPRIAVYLDQGKDGLIDPWGEAYIAEKRDEGDQIIITLRSNHMIRRKWYQKKKVIGFELIISRPDGTILRSNAFWR